MTTAGGDIIMKTKECMNKSKVHALILLLALAVLVGGLWAMSSDAAYAGSEGDDGRVYYSVRPLHAGFYGKQRRKPLQDSQRRSRGH